MGVLGEKWLSRVSTEVIPGGQTAKLKVSERLRQEVGEAVGE